MKRIVAIVLSLAFLGAQTMSSAQIALVSAKPARACCGCQQRDCCVTPAPAPPQSLPTAMAPGPGQSHGSLLVCLLAAWRLPAAIESSVLLVSASAPFPPAGVPLFTRHCARLI